MKKGLKIFIKIKHSRYLLLFFVLLIGFCVRLYKIENPVADWHSFRQADTASVSRIYAKNGIDFLYPRYHDVSTTQSGISNMQGYRFVEFPLYNAIHATFYTNFRFFSLEVWGRLLSIICSIMSALMIYLISGRYLNKMGSLFACLIFLFLPFNIYYSRVILPEPLAVLLALAGIWSFIKYAEDGSFIKLFSSSILFSLALLVKPYTVFFLIPIVFIAVKKEGIKNLFLIKKYYLYAFMVIMPFVLWRFWIDRYPEGIPFWKWTFNGDGIRFKPAFWKWIFGERLTKLILGYWGLIPFALGILSLKKKDVVVYSLLIGMFFYVCIIATANVRHDYYQSLIIPSVSIVCAYGFLFIWKGEVFGKLKMRILLLFCVFMMLVASYSEIKEFYRINRPEIILAGQAVNNLVPEDVLVIAPYYGDTAFLYQTKRRGWPVVDRPVNELIDKGASYFVSVDLNHYQTKEFEEKYKTLIKNDNFIILNLNEPMI